MRTFLHGLEFLSPYLIALTLLLVVLLAGTGCVAMGSEAAGGTRSAVTTAATTAAGAYIGAKEGDGKARNAALGAAVGFVLGETIGYFADSAQRDAYLAGYEKGQSNAVKQQYWVARENQRPQRDDGYEETLYEIDVPPTERGGVRREGTTRVIRVVMPRQDTSP